MPRARIILETSDRRKSAVANAAALQGSTISDLFEEYLVTALPAVSKDELPHEQAPIVELEDTATVLESLHTTDWSFTDDDTRYLTHDLHPYPAKFIPQIPARLIAQLSAHGDTVLDPFGGSATTAVEAVRLGRRGISFDANPLSALIGRVKTGFMTPRTRADIEQLYAAVEGHITCYSSSTAGWAESLTARNRKYLPDIPNIRKWFNQDAIAELCLLRHLIEQTTDGLSQDAALLALSRIIIRVSYQESETRYVSVKKNVVPTLVLRAYCESLRTVSRRLESAAQNLQFADARFFVGDSRSRLESAIGENSIDLIVTSPPYPNATDYHLYHRFRLFWLGYDPKELSKIEIGSHLRHQRNHTGFEEYCEDMDQAMYGCAKVLMPGRYAVFVVGDAIFKGELFSTSEAICTSAEDSGLIVCSTIEREIHNTKRSFATPARRARTEQIVILRKPNVPVTVRLFPPNYRMWDYERLLRAREIESLTGCSTLDPCTESSIVLRLEQPAVWRLRQLTFTQFYSLGDDRKSIQETWQKVIENGDLDPASRKDPKYVTHGLHAFKGKFYPQLAKSLLNISGAQVGSKLLDPFCGSGTTLLEGMLNGYHGFGCDLNPLAAKMSQAKTGVLSLSREVVDSAIRSVIDKLSARESRFVESLDQFSRSNHGELFDWFPLPVLYKLNWLLGQLRLFGNRTLVDFFEVIVSGLLRDVSYQDPSDLRIRRRKDKLVDGPVIELFRERLLCQYRRLQKYWVVAGRQPSRLIEPTVIAGDSRLQDTFFSLGLEPGTVDCVVTSPPYATALPYVDTDRLSLLAIMDVSSKVRTKLQEDLTGSREIRRLTRTQAEDHLLEDSAIDSLPHNVVTHIRNIYHANRSVAVGFRRANMAALLWRYFQHMKDNLVQVIHFMKPGARAFYVVGNSRTKAGGSWTPIETCRSIAEIGEMVGLRLAETINVSVTRENMKHIKNAITENQIIVFEKVQN